MGNCLIRTLVACCPCYMYMYMHMKLCTYTRGQYTCRSGVGRYGIPTKYVLVRYYVIMQGCHAVSNKGFQYVYVYGKVTFGMYVYSGKHKPCTFE